MWNLLLVVSYQCSKKKNFNFGAFQILDIQDRRSACKMLQMITLGTVRRLCLGEMEADVRESARSIWSH